MDNIKQIFKGILSILKVFSKETNRVKAFFSFVGIALVFGLFYFLYSSQQQIQESERKRIEAEERMQKLLIQSKEMGTNVSAGKNINGPVGNNNTTTSNQSNSGGINLASASIENSSINNNNNIITVVMGEYTKYSSGDLDKYITNLKDNGTLNLTSADEIIKQISNKATINPEEKQKQETLINTLFQKFSFDTNGDTAQEWQQFKSYTAYERDIVYNGCYVRIEKITPYYKNEKFNLKLIFGIKKGTQDFCYIFFPNEVVANNTKNETGFYFLGTNAVNNSGSVNLTEKYKDFGLRYESEQAGSYVVNLEGKEFLGRKFSLEDTKSLNLKYNYLYGWNKASAPKLFYNDNKGYFIWKIDEKYGVSVLESK